MQGCGLLQHWKRVATVEYQENYLFADGKNKDFFYKDFLKENSDNTLAKMKIIDYLGLYISFGFLIFGTIMVFISEKILKKNIASYM